MSTENPSDVALLWLNDHCGKNVSVTLRWDVGDRSVGLFHAAGELRHWRDRELRHFRERKLTSPAGDELRRGSYYLGDARIDLTRLPNGTTVRRDRGRDVAASIPAVSIHMEQESLEIEIADGVWLHSIAPQKAKGGDA